MHAAIFPILAALAARPEGMAPAESFACRSDASTLSYKVVHPFNTVRGTSHAPACTVWINADTTEFRVHVTAPVRSFDSGNDLRDSHAMDAVEADKHPRVTFTSGTVSRKDGRLGPYAVAGTLTFHGVEKPVTVEARPEMSGGRVVVRGTFPIRLTEHGVERPSLMFVPVRDEAEISFELVFPLGG